MLLISHMERPGVLLTIAQGAQDSSHNREQLPPQPQVSVVEKPRSKSMYGKNQLPVVALLLFASID